MNLILSLFIWRKLKIKQPHETFLSKIEGYSLVGFESSNKNPKFRGLGEQVFDRFQRLFTLNEHQMVSAKYVLWNWRQNSSWLVLKTQQPETVWPWISKNNKKVKHGRSLYLKIEPFSLSSSLWSKNSVQR